MENFLDGDLLTKTFSTEEYEKKLQELGKLLFMAEISLLDIKESVIRLDVMSIDHRVKKELKEILTTTNESLRLISKALNKEYF